MGTSKGPKVPKKVYVAVSSYDGGVYYFTSATERKTFISDASGDGSDNFVKATYVQEVK